jgi:hypothetical protein
MICTEEEKERIAERNEDETRHQIDHVVQIFFSSFLSPPYLSFLWIQSWDSNSVIPVPDLRRIACSMQHETFEEGKEGDKGLALGTGFGFREASKMTGGGHSSHVLTVTLLSKRNGTRVQFYAKIALWTQNDRHCSQDS